MKDSASSAHASATSSTPWRSHSNGMRAPPSIQLTPFSESSSHSVRSNLVATELLVRVAGLRVSRLRLARPDVDERDATVRACLRARPVLRSTPRAPTRLSHGRYLAVRTTNPLRAPVDRGRHGDDPAHRSGCRRHHRAHHQGRRAEGARRRERRRRAVRRGPGQAQRPARVAARPEDARHDPRGRERLVVSPQHDRASAEDLLRAGCAGQRRWRPTRRRSRRICCMCPAAT